MIYVISDLHGYPHERFLALLDKDAERRRLAYCFKMIREKSGMSRTDFSAWLGVPYRTMQEWELGRRAMPEYVLRLIAYKVYNEKIKKEE